MAKKVAAFGIFAALAMVAGYMERLIPMPIPVPGVKIGLANVVVLLALYAMGPKAAFGVSLVRIVMSGLLFGNPFSMLYSLAGGLLSYVGMVAGKKAGWFSVAGVSIIGGVFHNLGQIAVAALAVQNRILLYYAPVMIIAGIGAGALTGVTAVYTLSHMRRLRMIT